MARPTAYAYAPRARRRPSRAARRARRTAMLVLAGLACIVIAALAAFSSSPTAPGSAVPAAARFAPAGPPDAEPLAVYQSGQSDLKLQLPISRQRITAIGYHAAGEDALPLGPVGHRKNEGLFTRVFRRIFGGSRGGLGWYQLGGGEGPSTGAVDVGAEVGIDVYSPVSGIVVSIRDYVLDGRTYGNVVQFQPDGAPSLVVTATHIAVDPSLTVGSPVTASITPIGRIVDFSRVERQSLSDYTQDTGNHVSLGVYQASTSAPR